jgi:hypothetical protein
MGDLLDAGAVKRERLFLGGAAARFAVAEGIEVALEALVVVLVEPLNFPEAVVPRGQPLAVLTQEVAAGGDRVEALSH